MFLTLTLLSLVQFSIPFMIRNYSPKDREACLQIFDTNCPKYFMPGEREGFERWLTGQDEGKLAYRNTEKEYFYVVEENDAVIGCGGFYVVEGGCVANLVWGMINSSLHGKGFGRQLFNYRMEKIKELYGKLPVTMDTSQHTFPFYEKMGLKVSSITRDAYGIGLDRYDME